LPRQTLTTRLSLTPPPSRPDETRYIPSLRAYHVRAIQSCDMTDWWIAVVTLSVVLGTTIWSFVRFDDD
jgi:hypothetical protein